MNKKISLSGLGLIQRHEGLRLQAYLCPGDVWTIGYGHTKNVRHDDQITEAQAKKFLLEDVEAFERVVNAAVRVEINQNQFDALVSLAFNIGAQNFRTSTLLKKLNEGNYLAAAAEFKKWRKGGGKVLPGLVKRRKEESELFLKPLRKSRTVAGAGTAATSGTAAAIVSALQDTIPAAQDAVRPLSEYLEIAKYVLLFLVVAGAAVALYARISDAKKKGV